MATNSPLFKNNAPETHPRDDVIPSAQMVHNQYRTIKAPAAAIFPWLIQLGARRGGWYLPSRYEKLLPPSWRASQTIDPTFQQLKVGDRVPDYGGANDYCTIQKL